MVEKFLVLIVCLVGLCNSISIKPRATGDETCGAVGETSKVVCVTKTEFKFSFDLDNDDAVLVKCPNGTVCADTENPCVPKGFAEPACRNEVVGGEACNSCLEGDDPNVPVCISPTEYALCRNGQVDTSATFECQSPLYCHATIDETDGLTSICSISSDIIDCPDDNGGDGPGTEGPGVDDPGTETRCTAEGYFANTSDTTCRGYIKCTKNADGTFNSESLSCQVGFSFNPATRRCVPSASYQCTQTGNPGTGTSCTAEGYFADTTDKTCRGYKKCTKNADGTFNSDSLSCVVGFSFNSATRRCVPSSSYQCTN